MFKTLTVALLLVIVPSLSVSAQHKSRRSRKANHTTTITAKSGESLSSVATRANVSAQQLADANGLELNSRLRKGQRLILPTENEAVATKPTGEIVGKRINYVDGTFIDVDDVWQQGDSTWYRTRGTSQSASRPIRNIEDRYKSLSSPSRPPTVAETPKKSAPVVTWIYLNDGARLRVDDVRETGDGTWYTRGNLNIFLAKERVARIEREDPNEPTSELPGNQTWSSGNLSIDSYIHKHASRYGVDPYLVFLVIEQESHFHTRALSPKGAQGLMQLMPGTARRFGVSRPFDAGENIRAGTQYLKELLTMFKGRVDLALASYNAGEGRVLDFGNRVPPFKETQDYVKKISSRYRRKPGPTKTGTKE